MAFAVALLCFTLFIHESTSSCIPLNQPDPNDSLVLLHILHRHGNRTADSKAELYPKDPYLNKTYFPIGLGQLTNEGKRKEFAIGQALRRTYHSFLGDVVYPELIEAISTDYNRTKVSLLLCLAGLFPPKGEEVWNSRFSWQPIPYNFRPRNDDKVLMGINCPNYVKLYNENRYSPQQQAVFAEYTAIFKNISEATGLNVTSFVEIYDMYFGLSTEAEYGLELPEWTKSLWPDTIVDLSIKEYYVSMATTDLKRLAAGYFIEKIINDTQAKINEDPETEFKKKMYIYSAHENNIAEVLLLLDIFEPHIPTYGTYLVFEIHKIDEVYGIKILYQNYSTSEPQLMKIPACEEICPLDKFIELFSEYIPDENLCYL